MPLQVVHSTVAASSQTRPRVVIVGAGFGGLEAARALARAPAEVVVIDARNHHTFQPLLYQVATAALSPAEIAWPVRHLLKTQGNARVLMARATGLDPAARTVETDQGPLAYDQLVIAAGATHSYFGNDAWEAFAPGLKSIEDALAIRRRILSAFEHAELAGQGGAPAALTTFVVVGGGPTGVEMAGAIAEIARDALKSEFRHIDPAAARIVLVEAGPRILPSFPERLAADAARRLARYGVEVMTGARVIDIDHAGVTLEGGRIDAATVVWGAGVQAGALTAGLPADHDRAGRAKVGPDLSLPGYPDIFVIGDGAAAVSSDGRPIPGIAPAAKQMGAYVGGLIARRLEGRPAPPPFRYRHAGDLATIGRGSAVVKVGPVQLTGLIGWLFWGFIHIYFLIGLRARFFVALDWLWSYVTYHRGARLITGAASGREKNSAVSPSAAGRRSESGPRRSARSPAPDRPRRPARSANWSPATNAARRAQRRGPPRTSAAAAISRAGDGRGRRRDARASAAGSRTRRRSPRSRRTARRPRRPRRGRRAARGSQGRPAGSAW